MGTTRFLPDRIRRTIERLVACAQSAAVPVAGVMTAEGPVWHEDIDDEMRNRLAPFGQDDTWGGRDLHRLFAFGFTVPPEMAGQPVRIGVVTGREGNWNAMNPQFLAYVNGELIQGIDTNHREFELTVGAAEGTPFRVELIGWSGMHDIKAQFRAKAFVRREDVIQLIYDLKVPYECAVLMAPGSRFRGEILEHLNSAVNLLDMRQPGSREFFISVAGASEYLKSEFYGRYCGRFNEATVTALGHTHIDVAWLWTLYQTEQKTLCTFSTMVRLAGRYPEFIFMSSQPQLYKYLKNRDPRLYEKIRALVRSGQWEPEGAMWLEADCNVPSGEGLVRQVVHGKRFFLREFGVDSKILWLPDVFGYSAALPQILKKSGVDYFMTTKISWSESNKNPNDTFLWQGIDGTEVLSHFVTTIQYPVPAGPKATTYNGRMDAAEHMGTWERYQHKAMNQDVLTLFGYGDGGGGSTEEMIEYARRFAHGIPGTPRLRFGKAGDYFRRLEETVSGSRRLPRWVGELYLEFHRGTYTAQANNKRFNRRSEYACANAEWLSDMAARLAGAPYPAERIYDAWEETLLLQFHDILPGSSIGEVYADSDRQYAGILGAMNGVCRDAMRALARRAGGPGVRAVMFNPAAFEVSEVAVIGLPEGWENARVTDPQGNECPSQAAWDGKLAFMAQAVPSKGYKAFSLKKAPGEPQAAARYEGVIENRRVTVRFDGKGAVASLFDRIEGRELLKKGETAGLRTYYEAPKNHDNWEISDYYDEQSWDVDDLRSARIVESGNLRTVLRLEWNYLSSAISQDVIVYAHTDRIDFVTHADWKESNILLKAVLPLDIHAVSASFDIQYGNIERPTHENTSWQDAQFEVAAHKWADLSESAYGAAILSDSKYGYSVKHGRMTLSLIKSTCYPDPGMDKKAHDFTYSFVPHEGGWRQAGIHRQSCVVNQPLMAETVAGSEPGELPSSFSSVGCDAPNVLPDVVKRAYDGRGVIVRAYESEGARTRVTFAMPGTIASVCECDLLENDIAPVESEGAAFASTLKPYEIKTFRIQF